MLFVLFLNLLEVTQTLSVSLVSVSVVLSVCLSLSSTLSLSCPEMRLDD